MASTLLECSKARSTQMPAHWSMGSNNIGAGGAVILMAAKQLV